MTTLSKHANDIERLATSVNRTGTTTADFCKPLTAAATPNFDREKLDEAWSWVKTE